jgi:hypothetical protein
METVLLFGDSRLWRPLIQRAQGQFNFVTPDFSFYGNVVEEDSLLIDGSVKFDFELMEKYLFVHSPCHVVAYGYGAAHVIEHLQLTRWKPLSVTLLEPESLQLLRESDPNVFAKIDEFVLGLLETVQKGELKSAAKKYVQFWAHPITYLLMSHKRRAQIEERISKYAYELLPMYTRSPNIVFTRVPSYPVTLLMSQFIKDPERLIMRKLEEAFDVKAQAVPKCHHLSLINEKSVELILDSLLKREELEIQEKFESAR